MKLEKLEDYLKKVLPHYAQFNDDTWKWEITFDELNEMVQFYLDKYWEEVCNRKQSIKVTIQVQFNSIQVAI